MPVSPSFRTYVLEQLQGLGTVTAKAMFGGVGLYLENIFFGLMADDTLYFKVDSSTRPEYEAAGAKAFQPYGENSYSMQYCEVPADVLEEQSALKAWATKAVAVARKSATAKRTRSRRSN
jgi:DNA transformation protein and related proteins